MPVQLFGAVRNYPQMLRKIAVFTFFSAAFAISVLRSQLPFLEKLLAPFSWTIPILQVPIPFGTFFPAFVVALLCRMYKFHDRLSDLFRIREHFDTRHILVPMASDSGVVDSKTDIKIFAEKRRELMSKVFYKYASSTPNHAVIDTHYVTMALDQWSWFWIVLEALPIVLITSLILFTARKTTLAAILLFTFFLGILLLWSIWKGCRRYARQEIDQILSDPDRKKAVAEVFNAL